MLNIAKHLWECGGDAIPYLFTGKFPIARPIDLSRSNTFFVYLNIFCIYQPDSLKQPVLYLPIKNCASAGYSSKFDNSSG